MTFIYQDKGNYEFKSHTDLSTGFKIYIDNYKESSFISIIMEVE